MENATQTLDTLLNKPTVKDLAPLRAQLDQLNQLKALEEAAKENKKQELIKNATQAINGLIAITKAQDQEKRTLAAPLTDIDKLNQTVQAITEINNQNTKTTK